ncbi:phosphatidylinositol mannoside acyltransferase [Auraticoccus cholistanensis]|uniref:phosphatidylinositol mannoside acyltransferase n=1 Tax=Auraticoccus cholistanensis TaxID=2656650 RepID=UPI0018D24341
MSPLRDAATRRLLAAGWRLGPHLGRRTRRVLTGLGAGAAHRLGGAPVEQLRHNLAVVTGTGPDERLVRDALTSYTRMWLEVLSLPGWSREQVRAAVVTDPVGESLLRREHARRGAVVALPHMANWDLVGAWACSTGLPVTTVAEQLDDPEFAAFTRFREGLGMEVLSHRDPQVLARLLAAVEEGRVVCLMADRLMAGRGLDVRWPLPGGPRPVAMPPGPALVARRSGALLLGLACSYTGDRMRMRFSRPVEHRPGRDGLTAMTQQLADFFAGEVARHPQDWHVLQPFFGPPGADPSSGGRPR